jgi:uncharacterized ion transporter superfamily protein YfcC
MILNRNDLFLVVSCDSSPLVDCLEERGGIWNELFVVVVEKHKVRTAARAVSFILNKGGTLRLVEEAFIDCY